MRSTARGLKKSVGMGREENASDKASASESWEECGERTHQTRTPTTESREEFGGVWENSLDEASFKKVQGDGCQ